MTTWRRLRKTTRMARALAIGGEGAGRRKKQRKKQKKLLCNMYADSFKAQSKGLFRANLCNYTLTRIMSYAPHPPHHSGSKTSRTHARTHARTHIHTYTQGIPEQGDGVQWPGRHRRTGGLSVVARGAQQRTQRCVRMNI